MFTGIVEELGKMVSVRRGADSARLVIAAQKVLSGGKIGDSIAVNGVCLTVVRIGANEFSADVMPETLAKTNLGELGPGDRVNLELALALGDRLGGHLVSGHIDGVGAIDRKEKHDIATLITIRAPQEVLRYIIRKGSVAIDGTSLTVVDYDRDTFQVSLIPHTAAVTVLGFKKVGDRVNLEGDLIGKYVERMMTRPEEDQKPAMDMNFLARNGFI